MSSFFDIPLHSNDKLQMEMLTYLKRPMMSFGPAVHGEPVLKEGSEAEFHECRHQA